MEFRGFDGSWSRVGRKKYNAEFEFIVLQLSIGGVSEEEGEWGRILSLLGLVLDEEKEWREFGALFKNDWKFQFFEVCNINDANGKLRFATLQAHESNYRTWHRIARGRKNIQQSLYGIRVCNAGWRFLIGVKEQAWAFEEVRWVAGRTSRSTDSSWGIIAALDRGGSLPKRRIRDRPALNLEANREVPLFLPRMTKTRKLKRNWSVCDLKILIWLICKHCQRDTVAVGEVHNHW